MANGEWRMASPVRLLVARQHVIGAFPWREEIERAEFLVQRDLVVDDALFLIIPAHFNKTGEREVLAQRMSLEAVVGEDAAHVGMAGEKHAIEIVGLALEPVGALEHADDGR